MPKTSKPTKQTKPATHFNHFMLDSETLGLNPDAVVLQIALVAFDPLTGIHSGSLNLFPSLDEQLAAGRRIDASTLLWWAGNSPDLFQKMLKSKRDPAETVIYEIKRYIGMRAEDPEKVQIWSHATFDVPLVTGYAANFGEKNLFYYRSTRDIRTLEHMYSALGGPDFEHGYPGIEEHDAVNDCLIQISEVSHMYSWLTTRVD